MKRLMYAVVAYFLLLGTVQAQDMEFLLDGRVSVSAFGGPIIEFSSLSGDIAVSSGGGGALLLDKRFFIGGYGLNTRTEGGLTNKQTSLGHGGFWLGFVTNPEKLAHFGVTSKFGWGTARVNDIGINSSDNVFIVSPEVIAEFNITKWCKVNAGAGYRLATGFSSDNGLSSSDFSSPTFTLNFLFGWFNR